MKFTKTIVTALSVAAMGMLQPVQALPKVGKFKFTPMRTVPSASVVKEVSGIQYRHHVDVPLKNGLSVRCFPAATDDPTKESKNWYYLPENPRIAKAADGTPNFSMIRFVTNKSKEEGGADGAILHFMVEYGLTKEQRAELQKELRKEKKGAIIKGAVPLEHGAEGSSFAVVSATLNDKGFASTLITSGKAPIMEGKKVAVAARLDQYGATLLAKSMENSTADISVVFNLQYVVKLPAYDVKVHINYDQFRTVSNEITESRDKTSKKSTRWTPKVYNIFHRTKKKTSTLTEKEEQAYMDFLEETGVVKFEYDQHIPGEDKEIVESGLHKLVMEQFFEMQSRIGTPSAEESGEDAGEDEAAEDSKSQRKKEAAKVNHYTYKLYQQKAVSRKAKETLHLKKVSARYEPHQMVGNIGDWYNKYKDNPKLFSEVNLDDPFFKRSRATFVISGETYDIFNDAVNYVAVKVRVKRKGQKPYVDEIIIDKKYLEDKGQTATLSFARMGDDTQNYEYAVQWSLRGGKVYPAKPKWIETDGTTDAVTLSAPVVPVTIEAETDLEQLEKLGIARASLQLRYKKFGKTYKDIKGLAFSPKKGDDIVSKTIFIDKGSDKIEYKLKYHHKKGKIGTLLDSEWRAVDGVYLYCTPTDTVVNKIKSLIKDLVD
ncbi:MAG: hypothetical protein D6B27_08235 [Gammaproteobacteria bacterium]|nr:MAG: hypothetical protein D6B27_08235 [Gammaproteobacteria bacterium]